MTDWYFLSQWLFLAQCKGAVMAHWESFFRVLRCFPLLRNQHFPVSFRFCNARIFLSESLWTPWCSVGKQITYVMSEVWLVFNCVRTFSSRKHMFTFEKVANVCLQHGKRSLKIMWAFLLNQFSNIHVWRLLRKSLLNITKYFLHYSSLPFISATKIAKAKISFMASLPQTQRGLRWDCKKIVERIF